jgi:hypothetical protein
MVERTRRVRRCKRRRWIRLRWRRIMWRKLRREIRKYDEDTRKVEKNKKKEKEDTNKMEEEKKQLRTTLEWQLSVLLTNCHLLIVAGNIWTGSR